MSTVDSKVGSYHDFHGLGELRGQAQRRDGTALREVAQQFEAMFIQQIMKTMREAGIEGGQLFESQAMETFQNMHDKEISLQMAKRGSFGLADMLVKSMERHEQAIPAAQMLSENARLAPDAAKPMPLNPERAPLPVSRPARAYAIDRVEPSAKPLRPAFPLKHPAPNARPEGSDVR